MDRKKKRKKKTSHPPGRICLSSGLGLLCGYYILLFTMNIQMNKPHRLAPLSKVPPLPAKGATSASEGQDPGTVVASPLAPLPSEAGE